MSYNLVDPITGDLTQVAGNGKAEYGASSMRTGTFTTSALQPQTDEAIVVTFSSPMPDTDYIVDFEAYTSMYTISIVNNTKTVNGFTAKVRNVADTAGNINTVTYRAYKLYSDVEYSNIVNSMPGNASASNKLVTASDNNFKYQVLTTDTDLNNIKTSGAYSIYISDATSQATNHAPVYGWLQFCVIQMNNSDAYCQQILYYSGDGVFMRECSYNVWSDWKQLATKNKTILHHDISIPVASGTTLTTPFDALQYQLIHTDWTFLTSSDWNTSSGGYELQGYHWGSYTATHTTSNHVVVTGTITWEAKPHTFSAYHDAAVPAWKITIDGEELIYNNNNIIVIRDVLTEKRLFIRNTAETNIGALYSALDTLGLLNRPSIGVLNWTVQQARTYDVGTPHNANHWTDTLGVGVTYFQNPRISTMYGATNEWNIFWADGNGYYACNMWGESNPVCTYISLEYII